MSYVISETDLEEVRAIMTNSKLVSIDFHELSARRNEPQESDESAQGRVTVEVQQRVSEDGFGIRLNATALLPVGEVTASVAGEYSIDAGLTPGKRALQLFANEVAVMTVYPYLREAVASITAKVFGQPVHFPIAQRGEIALDVDDE